MWPRSCRGPEPAGPDDDAFEAEALSLVDNLYAAACLTGGVEDAEELVYETYRQAFRRASRELKGRELKV